ncbi:hypothetical protein [Kibdelosporangium philippinense]
MLNDVAATDVNHAWAVGSDKYDVSDMYNTGEPLAVQWNGT